MVKLSLRKVAKRFGDNLVCRGIDLDIAQGELVCLIGASGAGKSTLRGASSTFSKAVICGKRL